MPLGILLRSLMRKSEPSISTSMRGSGADTTKGTPQYAAYLGEMVEQDSDGITAGRSQGFKVPSIYQDGSGWNYGSYSVGSSY